MGFLRSLIGKLSIALIVIGGVFFFSEIGNFFALITKDPVDFSELSASDYAEKTIVEGAIKYVAACPIEEYEEDGTTQKNSGYYYLLPIVNTQDELEGYVLYFTKNKNEYTTLDGMMDEYYDETLEDTITTTYIKGKVVKIDTEVQSILYDWYTDAELDSYFGTDGVDGMSEIIIPYTIERLDEGFVKGMAIGGFVIMLVGVGLMIFGIIRRR